MILLMEIIFLNVIKIADYQPEPIFVKEVQDRAPTLCTSPRPGSRS